MSRKKIAIQLSGHIRNFDLIQQFHEYVDKHYKDSEYDIDWFASCWIHEEYTLSSTDIWADYEEIDFNSTATYPRFGENNEKYTYLIQRVNLLRNKYERENKVKYDMVLWTRIDITLHIDVLDKVFKDNHLNERTLYVPGSIQANKVGPAYYYSLNDNGAYALPWVMDIYANMFLYGYCDKEFNKFPCSHAMNPFFMISNTLLARGCPFEYSLVREMHRGKIKMIIKNEGIDKWMSKYHKLRKDDEIIPEE